MRRRSILAQADALEIEGLSAGKHGIDRTPEAAVCRLAGMRGFRGIGACLLN